MFESLSDPVDVLTAFVNGEIQPLRFRWKGRIVRVGRVTGRWNRREGQTRLQYFAIEDGQRGTYELCYDPRGPKWILSRAWIEGAR
ncbi:MAG TPA: hypothetical protein VL123_09505 [Candidatus Udaeobacter sp.]|jgi:hypothetical protein|nr:hypothetical protein [Candidatus Udaeobacter sp.]